jgi:hypothetical protein
LQTKRSEYYAAHFLSPIAVGSYYFYLQGNSFFLDQKPPQKVEIFILLSGKPYYSNRKFKKKGEQTVSKYTKHGSVNFARLIFRFSYSLLKPGRSGERGDRGTGYNGINYRNLLVRQKWFRIVIILMWKGLAKNSKPIV